nr:ribonuclease P protein component [uncultured Roseococcus sp.]
MLGRLKRRAEFVKTAKAGRRAARDSLVLQALARPDDETRIGFTATKKIGNAVARNRAKRRLRAAARLSLGAAPPTGWNLVLIARDATGSCPFPRLLADLDGAMKKAGVPRPTGDGT